MKAEEVFSKSVQVMKQLLVQDQISGSIQRAKERGDDGNRELLKSNRESINELVRKIAEEGGPTQPLGSVSQELIDGLVLRYFRNRDIFLTTFPEGIDGLDADPVSLWAALMISPYDNHPEEKS